MAAEDFWDRSADTILLWCYIAGLLSCLGILLWQSYIWLKAGYWRPLSFHLVFTFIGLDFNFVYNPRGWFGLAKLVQKILELPLSVGFPLTLILIGHIWKIIVSFEDT